MESTRKAGKVIRVLACILGGFIVVFFLIFLIGEGIFGGEGKEGSSLTLREIGMFAFLG